MNSPTSDRPAPPSGTGEPESATDRQSPTDALRDVHPRLKELAEYVNYLVAARIDAFKLSARNAGVYAALAVIAILAVSAFVVTAVVLLCLGVARGLTTLFGGRAWAGDLAAAALFFVILAGAVWIGLRKLNTASRERTVRKYASRQQQQRATYGTDVSKRAAADRK